MTAPERLREMARVLGDTEWGASLADELRDVADEAEREAAEKRNGKLRRQRMQEHVEEVQRICAERKAKIKELNVRLAESRAEAASCARMLGICADGTPVRRLDEVWTVDGDGPYHVACNWADGTASLVEDAGHVACLTLTHERPGSKTEADRARADDGEGMPGHGGDVIAWVEEHGGLAQVEDAYSDFRAVVERLGIEWSESELHVLMDVLDRRLMPEGAEWPRYTDGSPVEIGDDVVGPDYGERIHVDEVTVHANGFSLLEKQTGFGKWYEDGERLARPAPKVLDADGAEIRVGDAMWSANGVDLTVTKVTESTSRPGDWIVVGTTGRHGVTSFFASDLTHRSPAIAAAGRLVRRAKALAGKEAE